MAEIFIWKRDCHFKTRTANPGEPVRRSYLSSIGPCVVKWFLWNSLLKRFVKSFAPSNNDVCIIIIVIIIYELFSPHRWPDSIDTYAYCSLMSWENPPAHSSSFSEKIHHHDVQQVSEIVSPIDG